MTGDGRFAARLWGRHPEFRGSPGNAAGTRSFAFGEDSLALRLGSELPGRRHPESDRG